MRKMRTLRRVRDGTPEKKKGVSFIFRRACGFGRGEGRRILIAAQIRWPRRGLARFPAREK